VQASHAALDHVFHYPQEASDWHKNSNYLIFLSTKDEEELSTLSKRLQSLGTQVTEFREPDLGNQLTAIAFVSNDETRRITSGIPLMLKQKKKTTTMK
jgi:hypothetical protein